MAYQTGHTYLAEFRADDKNTNDVIDSSNLCVKRSVPLNFYDIFDNASIGIALVDLNGSWLEVNQNLCQMFGYSREELLKTNFQALTHPEDLLKGHDTLHALRQGEISTADFEKRYLHKDGYIIWAHLSTSLCKSEESEPYLISHIVNISDRKAAENDVVLQKAILEAQREASPDGILMVSHEREWLYTNARFRAMWGVADDAGFTRLKFSQVREIVLEADKFAAHIEWIYQHPNASDFGTVSFKDGRIVNFYSAPVTGPQGDYLGRVWHYRDVTERILSQEALLESEERFRQLTEAAFEAIAVLAKGYLLEVNDNFCLMFGYDREELLRRSLLELRLEPDHDNNLAKALHQERTFELTCVKKDQTTFIAEAQAKSLTDSQGRDLRVIALTDITERKRAEAKLQYDAFHDSLTGLKNRAAFSEQLAQVHAYYQRYPNTRFAVMFIDLDRFKPINDTYGHSIGDRVLVAVSQRLKACVRGTDTVSRLGGDEFIILLRDVESEYNARKVATNMLASLSESFVINDISIHLSASIGIAMSDQNETHPDYLIRNADFAMYQAKNQGKNRFAVFENSMRVVSLNLLKLETELRQALAHEDLALHYQPIVRLADQRVMSFEALLRWTKADGTVVSPAEFIPIAEDCGLIHALGKWVLSQACQQLKCWQYQRPDLSMHVNLSVKQLSDPDFPVWLLSQLTNWKITPSSLCLEITENLMLSGFESSMEVLHALYNTGVQLQIDDFGTGYSSLAYLHSFPVHALKIDRSFVMRLEGDERSQNIIKTIKVLAQTLELGVIAEGIETEMEFTFLRDLECQLGQGYYFSKAVPASKINLQV